MYHEGGKNIVASCCKITKAEIKMLHTYFFFLNWLVKSNINILK